MTEKVFFYIFSICAIMKLCFILIQMIDIILKKEKLTTVMNDFCTSPKKGR